MGGLSCVRAYLGSVNVTVVCFGAMREYLPDPMQNETRMDLDEGTTVEELVARLGAPSRLASSILLGEERGRLSDILQDGMRVTLMPPFSGG